jgi:hypothetical protein
VQSDWVREEVESCLASGAAARSVPRKAWASSIRRQWHIGDFRKWKKHDAYQKALERLLRDLKAENSGAPPGL